MTKIERCRKKKEHSSPFNIDMYIGEYQIKSRQPITFYSPYTKQFEQVSFFGPTLNQRTKAIREYLFEERTTPHYSRGRTILAEMVTEQILHELPLFKNGSFLESQIAPPFFDKTDKNPPYQKGGDIILFQREQQNQIQPLLVIDVTIGGKEIVEGKRAIFGINVSAETPVVVLPLADMELTHKKEAILFVEYLDTVVRPQIQKYGKFEPPIRNTHFMDSFSKTLLEGLACTENGLMSLNGAFGNATYVALEKLQEVKKMFSWGLTADK